MFIRNWKVRTKILGGLSAVLVLMLAISASFFMLLINASDTGVTVITSTSGAEEMLLRTSVEVMNMRRLTGMIHAFNGDEELINGYQRDFEASYAAANGYLDALAASAASADTITDAERANVAASTAAMKDLLNQYKTLLFDVNVESAKRSDVAALAASNAQYGALITSVSESVNTLLTEAQASKAAGIAAAQSMVDSLLTAFIIAMAIITPLSFLLALYIARMMYKPLEVLIAFMKKAGESGNITPSQADTENIRKFSQAKDEIGQTIGATAVFMTRITDISKILGTLAGGDLTTEITPLSDKDVLGLALQKVTTSLNTMFDEINISSTQVSAGSSQVANGAQALAAGSTEQAASVEQLSSSITEVAERTKDNSLKAEQAAKLASAIKGDAQKGSGQMDDMIQSVKAINEASQSISKVIKTIDDIAFQTNILALNAAVEAARAGQHGKGFAVVAEEVRNLAAKSAEAAKDTESLIADSMQKAERGVKIAGETAASLSDIVKGINESSTLMTEIARASEEQSTSISQINAGIGQVAKVVQQNSATAEESAAASQEMSSQSAMLRELISQFKLKESAEPPQSFAPRVKRLQEDSEYTGLIGPDEDIEISLA